MRRAVRRLTLGSGPLKRGSDRVEVLSRLVLAVVLLLAAPVALTVATTTATDLRATAEQEAATRTRVLAELVEDAASRPDTGTGTSTRTEASWTAPDGARREGEVLARPGMDAGEPVAVWIDRDGALTRAPLSDGDRVAAAALAGAGVFVLVVGTAGGAHGLVTWALHRHRDHQWAAGWAAVEPRWSGRLR
ncbi:hypothetical protein ACI8AC_04750 [Geodermatophilus sp. SYSU D00758]